MLIRHSFTVLVVVATVGMVWIRADGPSARKRGPSPTGVRDRARVFSPGAIRAATKILREIEESESRWQVLIETDPSLESTTAEDLAIANARALGLAGLSVVIGMKEQRVGARATEEAEEAFPADECRLISEAFQPSFATADPDRGLHRLVAEIRRAAMGVGIRDHARRFSPEAVASANEMLEESQRLSRWGVVIETVATLNGRNASEFAAERLRALRIHGLYVVVAVHENVRAAQASREARPAFTPERIQAISTALQQSPADQGLRSAIQAINRAIDEESMLRPPTPANPITPAPAPIATVERPLPNAALNPPGTRVREGLDLETTDPVWNALAIVLGTIATLLILGILAHAVLRRREPKRPSPGDPVLPDPILLPRPPSTRDSG